MPKSSSLSNSWSTISLLIRNKIREAAENIGLPTFVVADAGRTQVNLCMTWFVIKIHLKVAWIQLIIAKKQQIKLTLKNLILLI
jgi:hypothetical protein